MEREMEREREREGERVRDIGKRYMNSYKY